MKWTAFFIVICFFAYGCDIASHKENSKAKIIFDTDFGYDADDLGALAMLHYFIENDECELLGIACWSNERYGVSAIDAVNRFYEHGDIPIGVRKKDGAWDCDWSYGKPLALSLPYSRTYENVPHTNVLYRQLLANQPDKSVTIVTVGGLDNIKNLLLTGSDSISSLTGIELLHKKVKLFSVMGGAFPKQEDSEGEVNFKGGGKGVTKFVLEQTKGIPFVFAGYEIGDVIRSGNALNSLPEKHPLYLGFYKFSKDAPWVKDRFKGEIFDNASFDQIAVYYAVRETGDECFNLIGDGYCEVDSLGRNQWVTEPSGFNHHYLKLLAEPAIVSHKIESLMLGLEHY
ncbi:MAG: nucleoside hydrolase [Prolixibacteraceae bacterium]|nr:nucleoside hydrolase [Prolixibacteraceae bacterium]